MAVSDIVYPGNQDILYRSQEALHIPELDPCQSNLTLPGYQIFHNE